MREPVSGIDLALLRLEHPTNLMVVAGVLTLGKPVEVERLRAVLEERLSPFDRFRQRVVYLGKDGNTPYWEEDLGLDLDYHLQRIALPPPGDEADLQEAVSQMVGVPLDPDRPLWQFHLVEPFGTGCAVICRVHHSVGDGLALVRVLLSLTDSSAEPPAPAASALSQPVSSPKRPQEAQPGLVRLRAGRRAGRRWIRRGLRLAAHPSRLLEMADTGRQAATVLRRLALIGTEPHTALRGELGVTKRVAWSAALPLDSVKWVGRQLDGTVNDVLLAAVSGALRRYLLARGEPVEDVEIHVAIPVNLRPPGTEAALGNQVGAFLLLLPVRLADPAQRLAVIRRRMDQLKNSLEAPVILTGLKVFGAIPAAVETPLVDYFSSKLTAVMTNVVGPSERLYLAGAPVESFMFWVPKTGRVGLGVSFLSYAGQVRLGVISDAGLVPDPEAIIAAFQAEFDALLALAQEAGEKPSLRASLSLLDDAMATLDALLNSRVEGPGQAADDP